jgi:hypothetical protein
MLSVAVASYEEWLFAGTLDDLEEKLASKNAYQALMTAGLLRKLLLDDRICLLEQVNRKLREQIEFAFVPQSPPSDAAIWGAMDGFDGLDLANRNGMVKAPLKKFLSQPILRVGQDVFEVRDIIYQLAHVMGGVHVGRPANRKQAILKRLSILQVGGAPVLVRSVLSVGRITHRAMLPLRRRIVANDHAETVDRTRSRSDGLPAGRA